MMNKELLAAALHKHLSDRVLLNLVLSDAFASAESVADVLACVQPLAPAAKAEALLDLPLELEAAALEEAFGHRGIRVVLASSSEYPPALRVLPRPRPVLYVMGNPAALTVTGVGICGSRHASSQGLQFAKRFGGKVAGLGSNEVSGYAKGVDSEAHLGALEASGNTIVVLAEGILNFNLKRAFRNVPEVSNHMTVVSEFHPARPWAVQGAMQRNETICALSYALVVVEAQAKGGTFNAGLECLRQHKPLFVVQYDGPGEAAATPAGNRVLLGKGGVAVRDVMDLATHLSAAIERGKTPDANPAQQLTLMGLP